jgi:AbrB family looped-hinge helix DNA binding protein
MEEVACLLVSRRTDQSHARLKTKLAEFGIRLRGMFFPAILNIGDSDMATVVVGKRGTIVIPAKIRKRYRLDEGSPLLMEEREDGILMRPAVVTPVEVEVYTPERLAEFFLNNSMDKDDYLEARREVESMGIAPDSIDHLRWPD